MILLLGVLIFKGTPNSSYNLFVHLHEKVGKYFLNELGMTNNLVAENWATNVVGVSPKLGNPHLQDLVSQNQLTKSYFEAA